MARRIDTQAVINAVRLLIGGKPSAPAAGYDLLYAKTGGLYVENEGGTETGPLMANPMTTAGDLILGGASGAAGRLAIGANATVLTSNGTTASWAAAPVTVLNDYICIWEQQDSGVNAGDFTAGAWRTRALNVEQSDTAGHASLASNQITLAAGTYICRASSPAWRTNEHKAQLYNVTDDAVILVGTPGFSQTAASYVESRSQMQGKFTIAAPKVIELQHQASVTYSASGMGLATGFGIEIYAIVELWKVA